MIHIQRMEVEGFASIVNPFSYDFGSAGLNLIVGKNGVGKSTIFNALTWAIYGKTLKPSGEIEPWKSLDKKRGTCVYVSMGIGLDHVSLCRCKGFKGLVDGKPGGDRLVIWINGKLYTKHKHKKDLNKKLVEIMGMSFELFKNSVTFGQNLTRLLREKSDRQKELFEEAFSIGYINKARELAKEYRNSIDSKIKTHQNDIDKLENEIKWADELITEIKNNWAETKNELKTRRRTLRLDLKACRTQVRNIKTLKQQIKELEQSKIKIDDSLINKEFKLSMVIDQEEAEIKGLKNKLNEYILRLSTPGRKCRVCGQEINAKEAEKQRANDKSEVSRIRKKILDTHNGLESLKNQYKAVSSKLSKQKLEIDKNKEIDKKLEGLKNTLGKIQHYPEKVKDLKIQITNINYRLRETAESGPKQKIEKEVIRKARLIQERNSWLEINEKLKKNLKAHNWVIDDALSNKGLKAYVFNSMLGQINKRLRFYSRVGWRIEFLVDLDSGNKNFRAVIFDKDEVRPYEDLSGGEQQLVDIALAFAMHDVIGSDKFDILLMDEVFESLDKDNIELVIELLKKKTFNTKIHLVTHRKEFVTSSVKTIYLTKTRSGGTQVSR